jgi:hypothetical protein
MLIVKLTEREDGTIVVETPRQVIARFTKGERREDVIAYLQHKARQCEEELRIVEDFDAGNPNDRLTDRDFRHMMKRHF